MRMRPEVQHGHCAMLTRATRCIKACVDSIASGRGPGIFSAKRARANLVRFRAGDSLTAEALQIAYEGSFYLTSSVRTNLLSSA